MAKYFRKPDFLIALILSILLPERHDVIPISAMRFLAQEIFIKVILKVMLLTTLFPFLLVANERALVTINKHTLSVPMEYYLTSPVKHMPLTCGYVSRVELRLLMNSFQFLE